MSSIKTYEVLASTIDTPPTGAKTYFTDSSNGRFSCKDDAGVVTTVGDGVFDPDAVHVNQAGEIAGLSGVTPVAGDVILIEDASDSNNKKKVSFTDLVAFLNGGSLDHGSLAGLGDDDHTQYLNETRHDALPADNPHSVTAAQVGAPPTGRTITAGTALNGGGDLSADRTINHDNSAVTPGSYVMANLTVDAQGHITAASSNVAGVFGTEFQTFIDTSTTTFSTGTQTELRSETTSSKPAGTYRVAVHIQLEPGSASQNTNLNLRIDGIQIGLEYEDEGKDTGGDIRAAVNIFGYYTHGAVGTFDIEVWGDNSGSGNSVIHGHNIEVWRVS